MVPTTYSPMPTTDLASHQRRPGSTARAPLTPPGKLEAIVGIAVAVVGCTLWSLPSVRTSMSFDLGLAYQAGSVARRTGHPEHLATWISMPFLALLMALDPASAVVYPRSARPGNLPRRRRAIPTPTFRTAR